jgi:hypothetical protein
VPPWAALSGVVKPVNDVMLLFAPLVARLAGKLVRFAALNVGAVW